MLLARPNVVLSRGAPGVVVWSLCCSCLAAELGDFACTITTNRHFNWKKNIEMVCNHIFRLLKLYTAHKDPLSEFAAYLQELKESKPATCSIYIPIAYNQGVYSIVIYCHVSSFKAIKTNKDNKWPALGFPTPKTASQPSTWSSNFSTCSEESKACELAMEVPMGKPMGKAMVWG